MTAVMEQPAKAPPRGRRALRALSSVLIIAGLLLVVDAVLTVVWQEPVSWFYAGRVQSALAGDLEDLEQQQPTVVERRALSALPTPSRRLAFAARALDRKAKEGQPIGRIKIPDIGLSKVIVAGTDGGSLRKGPGHYPSTPLPGVHGTVGIAGHRTTYGAPFRHIDRVHEGDRIELEMPYGRFTYVVEGTRIVPPTALWVTRKVNHDRLILSACHPLYSAAKRIVVFARLVRSQPRGATLI